MQLDEILAVARGDRAADLLIVNGRVINVFSGEIVEKNIAVADGMIVGLGAYKAEEIVDAAGKYVAPGFVDPHVHIESAMVSVTEFARAVLPFGTTTVVADPHEIANVMGTEGIDYMLESSRSQPMSIYLTLPSCVPATHMETSGARLGVDELRPYIGHARVPALAEMMNYPGVIHADAEVLSKIEMSLTAGKPVDGHIPGVSGKALNAYIAAGISSDHECTTAEEARLKLEAGMHIMVREGTCEKNLQALLPVINGGTSRRMMWCTDDRHPHDLLEQGHIDSIVREAIHEGLDPLTAVQMATINPADYFGLKNKGAIAPGRNADFIFLTDLNDPVIDTVYSGGKLVAEDGRMRPDVARPKPVVLPSTMKIRKTDFNLGVKAESHSIRVIDVVPDQVVTRQSILPATISAGEVVADTQRDCLKLAVFERHRQTGNVGIAFVRGFGLKEGALASSVAHDSHNIIVVGTNDADMLQAVQKIVAMGGGLVAIDKSRVLAKLALPIGGLMSQAPLEEVKDGLDRVIAAAHSLGAGLKDPFMSLSFLALPVIPELKLTDLGLVDVAAFEIVPIFVD